VLAVLAAGDAAGADALEVTAPAERAARDELDARAASTVWMLGGCESWYLDSAAHRLTLVWPDFAHTFRERLSSVDLGAYEAVRASANQDSASRDSGRNVAPTKSWNPSG
jgi:hypothetical protein